MASPQTRRWGRPHLTVVGLLLLLCTVVGVWPFLAGTGFIVPRRVSTLARVTEVTGLTFPVGTRLIDGTEYTPHPIAHLCARLRMPEQRVRTFFLQPPFYGDTISSENPLEELGDELKAVAASWGALDAKRFLAAKKGPPFPVCIYVLAKDEPAIETEVFVFWFDN
jgi:hypothetical protein